MVTLVLSAFLLLSAFALVFIFGLLIDLLAGTPLNERVKVVGRKFTPSHFENGARTYERVPDKWTLRVENGNGRGAVAVPKPLHDSVADGEIIQVSGKRGRLSKKWYLYEASKDSGPSGL